ncbi:EI24 domain-containing protein [Mangrovimonas sp. YM274]|uniref:EI24 domain-containing protein n=1 Tax=Mangrovimonas sp. YM274 TaxID=3070660 RepID=UPI0027DB8B99|nr:EI24 domain-containing protein [Mangrovimonas sp. YM274]WMI68858.1 EI24 domain-containing protein [Mangrovimonas sp. YM274]
MLKNIFKAIQAYFGAFGLISKLGLWKYFVIPIVISFFTATSIGLMAYGFSDNIFDYILSIFPSWNSSSWLRNLSEIFIGLAIIAIGLLLYKHIVMALSAPFMSPVSERIEAHLANNLLPRNTKSTFSSQLSRGIKINLRNLFKELTLTIPVLLLGFIPVIGIASSVLLFLIQAYYAGFGNMDYTLERHLNYHDSIQFVKKNKGTAIGNGIVFLVCLLIPILGLMIVLPLSVTAASKETVRLLQLKHTKAIKH